MSGDVCSVRRRVLYFSYFISRFSWRVDHSVGTREVHRLLDFPGLGADVEFCKTILEGGNI